MKEKIELSFKDFLAALQTARLYGMGHPILKKAMEKTLKSITDVLTERPDFTIGIIQEEIAFDKEILSDLSSLSKATVDYIKERGIEKITFSRGLELFELEKFISLLSGAKEENENKTKEQLISIGVRNISVGRINESLKAQSSERKSLEDISSPLLSILNRGAVDGLALRDSINNIANNLGVQYQQLLKLNTLKRYDLGTFTHLINTSILSMYFASKIGFTKEVISEIGLSALFHDIGKLYISRSIIRKPGQLNDLEFSQMESHTSLGAALILGYVDTIGIMPVVVSFEHHLKYDLSGYPKLSFPRRPHIVSQIVSICDIYDALSERRSYKSDYPPEVIYKIMMRGRGTTYNPYLLDKFFSIIGVWPIGSIVALNDKRIAIVSEVSQEDIFSPQVKVIYPENEGRIINLQDNKKGVKIARYLNPWTEGKDFLGLI